MNLFAVSVTVVICIALIVFVIVRNQKDKKQFEQQLKNDYHKTKDEEDDVDADEVLK